MDPSKKLDSKEERIRKIAAERFRYDEDPVATWIAEIQVNAEWSARVACATLVKAAGCHCFPLARSGDFDGEIDYEGEFGRERPTVTTHDSRCPQSLAARILGK